METGQLQEKEKRAAGSEPMQTVACPSPGGERHCGERIEVLGVDDWLSGLNWAVTSRPRPLSYSALPGGSTVSCLPIRDSFPSATVANPRYGRRTFLYHVYGSKVIFPVDVNPFSYRLVSSCLPDRDYASSAPFTQKPKTIQEHCRLSFHSRTREFPHTGRRTPPRRISRT